MRTIEISYHYDDDQWWADALQLPGWTAVADSFEEVQLRAREGARFAADEPVIIVELGLPRAKVGNGTLGGNRSITVTAEVVGQIIAGGFSVVPGMPVKSIEEGEAAVQVGEVVPTG